MLVAIRILIGLICIGIGSAGGVLAFYLYVGVHFFVTDAVYDQREMLDFNVDTPFWRDLMSYWWFYLPVLVLAIIAVVLFVGGVSILLRIRTSNSVAQTESDHQIGERDAAPNP